LSCAICETRKEKRFCLAVHGRICPQCCGEQREVTLDCPGDCPYLQQARQNERPRQAGNLDEAALLPEVVITDEFIYEHEHLLVGLSFTLAAAARADRNLNDRDLIAALASLGRTYQTLVSSGLVYEQAAANIAQQNVVAAFQKTIDEYHQIEEKQIGYSLLKDSEVLRAIAFLLRLAHTRTSGRPRSRAFIDFLFAQFPVKDSGIVSPQEAGSRIIMP
jgi:hypothetical protein